MSVDSPAEHPYFMYQHIQAQPEAFREVTKRNRPLLPVLAARVKTCRRLFLVGIGTSLHAAQVAVHLFHEFAPQVDARAIHAFDFVNFTPRLSPEDCVLAVSHRGTKRFTRDALKIARHASCLTGIIVGEGVEAGDHVDFEFTTVGQEQSSAHTVSHTASVAVLSELVRQVTSSSMDQKIIDETIPLALQSGLEREDQMKQWAAEQFERRHIWIVGIGPTSITAREIALKIKETSYLPAEGMSVEELLHGPFQCSDSDDLFVLLPCGDTGVDRMRNLSQMIEDVGAHAVTAAHMEQVPASFASLSSLVPMQLFAYHLALKSKTNPDCFRLDDPRFATAMGRVKL